MFDLFRSRAKAVRYLIGAIMMLVALSMVITLVPGFMGASYSSGDPNIVAEIGNEVITVRDVSASLQQQMQNNQIPREMAALEQNCPAAQGGQILTRRFHLIFSNNFPSQQDPARPSSTTNQCAPQSHRAG